MQSEQHCVTQFLDKDLYSEGQKGKGTNRRERKEERAWWLKHLQSWSDSTKKYKPAKILITIQSCLAYGTAWETIQNRTRQKGRKRIWLVQTVRPCALIQQDQMLSNFLRQFLLRQVCLYIFIYRVGGVCSFHLSKISLWAQNVS